MASSQREKKGVRNWEFFVASLKCFSSTLRVWTCRANRFLNLKRRSLRGQDSYKTPISKDLWKSTTKKTPPPHSFAQIQPKMYLKSFCPTKKTAKMSWWSLKFPKIKKAQNAHGLPHLMPVFLGVIYNPTPRCITLHPRGFPLKSAHRRWNQGKDHFPKHRDDLGFFDAAFGCMLVAW